MDGMVCNELSEEDRQSFIRPFSLEDIKETIDELKHDKAAGPDGFPHFINNSGKVLNMIQKKCLTNFTLHNWI
jgi:hypothetical protein